MCQLPIPFKSDPICYRWTMNDEKVADYLRHFGSQMNSIHLKRPVDVLSHRVLGGTYILHLLAEYCGSPTDLQLFHYEFRHHSDSTRRQLDSIIFPPDNIIFESLQNLRPIFPTIWCDLIVDDTDEYFRNRFTPLSKSLHFNFNCGMWVFDTTIQRLHSRFQKDENVTSHL